MPIRGGAITGVAYRPRRARMRGTRIQVAPRTALVNPASFKWLARPTRRRRGKKALRRERRAFKQELGQPKGQTACKRVRTQIQNAGVTPAAGATAYGMASRTLYYNSLLDITYGTDLNEREGPNFVNSSGVRIDLSFRLKHTHGPKGSTDATFQTNHKRAINVAVVIPRGDTISTSGWFRNPNPTNDQSRDFPQQPEGTEDNLSWEDYHYLPINTSKYHVIKHKRFFLYPPDQNASSRHPERRWDNKNMTMYIPTNRQLAFDSTLSSVPEKNMFLCVWATQCYNGKATDGSFPEYTLWEIETMWKWTHYFREVRK